MSHSLLAVGSDAPDFAAVANDGTNRSLSEILERGHAVLVFYPGNNTPG